MEVYVDRQAVDVEDASTPTGRKEINELHVPIGRPVQAGDDLARTSSTISASPPSASSRTWSPAATRTEWFNADASRASTTCSATSTAAPSTPKMVGTVVVMEPSRTTSSGSRAARPTSRRGRPARSCSPRTAASPATGLRRRRMAGLYRPPRASSTGGRTVIGRRRVPPRVDPRPRGQDRRVQATRRPDAELPGHTHRRTGHARSSRTSSRSARRDEQRDSRTTRPSGLQAPGDRRDDRFPQARTKACPARRRRPRRPRAPRSGRV